MRFQLLESKFTNLQWMVWTDNVLRRQLGMLENLTFRGSEDGETVIVVIAVTVFIDVIVIVEVFAFFVDVQIPNADQILS